MKNNKAINYVIYARKSSESDEKQVQSIDDQVRVMRDLARDLGLTVVATLSEARSAKEPNARPVFAELLQKLQSGTTNGILTWKIDRLSRNPIDSAMIQWLLQQEKSCSIQTIGREYLPEDNAVILSIESSMANQYIRDLSKNVKRGLQSRIDKGIAPIKAPLGYLNTKTDPRGENRIIRDPERFPIIRLAWDLMLTGNHTGPAILETLNSEYGFRTKTTRKMAGKPLSRSGLYRIFNDPFYTGQFRYNGVLHEGVHEPMVTRQEFDRVQALLGHPGKPKHRSHEYAYVGLLNCAECGGPISATLKEKHIRATRELKTYTLYYCIRARKNATLCSQRCYTNAEIIDRQILTEIETSTILPEFHSWARDVLRESEATDRQETEVIRASQQKAIDTASHQLDRLTDMRLNDLLSDEEYRAKRNTLMATIARLREQLTTIDEQSAERSRSIVQALKFASDAAQSFARGEGDTKREVFSTMRLNSALADKKLNLQKVFWLTEIENRALPLNSKMRALELEHRRGTPEYLEARATLNPLLLELVDAIGTAIDREPTS